MNAETERIFEELILKRKVVTAEQLAAARRAQAESAEDGESARPLLEILIEQHPAERGTLRRLADLAALRSGQTRVSIAGFELLEQIGGGGMSAVYRANQTRMGRQVAVKLMKPNIARNKKSLERFVQEARASAKISHPNVVEAIDAGQDKGYYFFAMELVDGPTLWRMIDRDGRLPEKRCVEIGIQMARALRAAAEADMVHRDVKPENILIEYDTGTAKLADLGLVKTAASTDTSSTQAGVTLGTPNYISPEQARGKEDVDIRSDIYSLGATLYYAATGTLPFSGDTVPVVMTKHISEPLDPPNKRNPELSVRFSRVIQKMMAKKPENRYQTPSQLLADLERVAKSHRRPHARPAPKHPRPADRPRFPKPALIAGAVAGSLVLTVALFGILSYLLSPGGAADADREPAVHYQRAVATLAAARQLDDLDLARAEAEEYIEVAPEGAHAADAHALVDFVGTFHELTAKSTESPVAWEAAIRELQQQAAEAPERLPFADVVARFVATTSRQKLKTVVTEATHDERQIGRASRWAAAILATAPDDDTRTAALDARDEVLELARSIPHAIVARHMQEAGIPTLTEKGDFVEALRRFQTCVPAPLQKGAIKRAMDKERKRLCEAARKRFEDEKESVWLLIDYNVQNWMVVRFRQIKERLAIPELEPAVDELGKTVEGAKEFAPLFDQLRRLEKKKDTPPHAVAKLALDVRRRFGSFDYVADRIKKYQPAIDRMLGRQGLDEKIGAVAKLAASDDYDDAVRADVLIDELLRHPDLTSDQRDRLLHIRHDRLGLAHGLARVLYARLKPKLPVTVTLRLEGDPEPQPYTLTSETDRKALRLRRAGETIERRWDRLGAGVYRELGRGELALIPDDAPRGLYYLGAQLAGEDDDEGRRLLARARDLAKKQTEDKLPGRAALLASIEKLLAAINSRGAAAALAEVRVATEGIRSKADLDEAKAAWSALQKEYGETPFVKQHKKELDKMAIRITDAIWTMQSRPLNRMINECRWRDALKLLVDIREEANAIGPMLPPQHRALDHLVNYARTWITESIIYSQVFSSRPWREEGLKKLAQHENELIARRARQYAKIFTYKKIPRRKTAEAQREYAFNEQHGGERVRVEDLYERLARLNAVFAYWRKDREATARAEVAAAHEFARYAGRGGACLAAIMMADFVEERRGLSAEMLSAAHQARMAAYGRVVRYVPRVREAFVIPRAKALMKKCREGDDPARFCLMTARQYEAAGDHHVDLAREYAESEWKEKAKAETARAAYCFEKAETYYEAMIDFRKRWKNWAYHGHLGRGRIRERRKQYQPALADYEAALRRTSNWHNGYQCARHIADLCMHSGRLDRPEAARQAVNEVLRRTKHPDHRARIQKLLEKE